MVFGQRALVLYLAKILHTFCALILIAHPTLFCTKKIKHVQKLQMMTVLHIHWYFCSLGTDFEMLVRKNQPFWLCWSRLFTAEVAKNRLATKHNQHKHRQQQPTWAAATQHKEGCKRRELRLGQEHRVSVNWSSVGGDQVVHIYKIK